VGDAVQDQARMLQNRRAVFIDAVRNFFELLRSRSTGLGKAGCKRSLALAEHVDCVAIALLHHVVHGGVTRDVEANQRRLQRDA